jgi:hypothetical protein
MEENSQRGLEDYLQDIQAMREAMLQAENQLRVPAWFFFAMAALIAIAAAAHAVLATLAELSLQRLLLFVWVPFALIAGFAELYAWIQTGRQAGLPWRSRPFGRFFVTVAGIMVAVVTMAIVLLFLGASASGVVFLLSAAALFAYSAYSPPLSLWLGWIGIIPGVVLMVLGVESSVAAGLAGAYVVVSFVLLGLTSLRSGAAEPKNPDHG